MSAPPYMPLFVGDYLADTTHLTVTEHGAYMLLLMAMWRADGALPNDAAKLARFARCTSGQWARISDTILAFFDVDGAQISHGRLSRERTKHAAAVEQRRHAASNGGKAKARKINDNVVPDASSPLCQPEPEPIEEATEAKASSPRKLVSVPVAKPRGSRTVPEGWAPTPADLAMGGLLGLTPGEIERELSRFRRHEFPRPYTHWSKTFQNWLDKAAERRPSHDRPHHDAKFDARQANLARHDRGAEIAARLYGRDEIR